MGVVSSATGGDTIPRKVARVTLVEKMRKNEPWSCWREDIPGSRRALGVGSRELERL